ncbi:hypothetical protein BSR29_02155 [Boudabousia liubingyangii]|uniref:Cytosolic endo-beta-N-acetylglucosaminidase TIM barrel domain-containing protein n=1 Tax=Boudabousia liubingyangii TaxID=1921764 RepID=A0A1Q5PQM3_9ACTO|nr:hypothetical protein [Boudabousia liubingyangii]OKL49772.1 hypothetical protein BSR29_02155 [Boudabousia liubingyangii]
MQHKQKTLIASLASLSLIGTLGVSQALAADSFPPVDDQALKSAQPRFAGYRIQEIENWSPQTDPYAPYLRAQVPLQKRVPFRADAQVQKNLDGKAEIMLMQGDYGNAFFDTSIYNNDATENTLNFWQYTDYYSPWHGAATAFTPAGLYDPKTSNWRQRGFEFGIVNIPNPAYTNAAHRNGVKSIATIYFDPAFRPGLTFKEMFKKDSKGYVIANKLIEMANYYGFDGYFLNQEEHGNANEFKPFMAYLTKQGLWTQWYDTNSYYNGGKRTWLKDGKHGQIHNSVFVNYGWPSDVNGSVNYAKRVGDNPYTEVFFGVEANQGKFAGSHPSAARINQLYQSAENHSPRGGIALFTPSDYYQRGLDDDIKIPGLDDRPLMQTPDFQWMIRQRERMYFSGVAQDVTKTGKQQVDNSNVGVSNSGGWVGVADFTPARSVLGGSDFASDFNTGHGYARWTNGQKTSDTDWSNINEQAILPSWQWWLSGEKTLKADFDFGSEEPRKDTKGNKIEAPFKALGAYQGGNSLVVYGEAKGTHDLRLFRTETAIKGTSQAEITLRSQGEVKAQLAYATADQPDSLQTLDLGTAVRSEQGWNTYQVDLSSLAGKTITTWGLRLNGNGKIQVNLGKFAVQGDRNASAPTAPKALKIAKYFTDGQVYLNWALDDFGQVDYYQIESLQNGKLNSWGRVFASDYYLKDVDLSAGPIEFQVRAIDKAGRASAPAKVTLDPAKSASDIKVAETPAKGKKFREASTEGKLDVSFNPVVGAAGYQFTLQLLTTPTPDLDRVVFTKQVSELGTEGGRLKAEVPVPTKDGYDYELSIEPIGVASAGKASFAGRTHDSFATPLAVSDLDLSRSGYTIGTPSNRDWYELEVSDGEDSFTIRRAFRDRMLHQHRQFSDGTLSFVITDYHGNRSAPLKVKFTDGKGTPLLDEVAPATAEATLQDRDLAVTWHGFSSHQPVTIEILKRTPEGEGNALDPRLTTKATSNLAGSGETVIKLPNSLLDGKYLVRVTSEATGTRPAQNAQAEFKLGDPEKKIAELKGQIKKLEAQIAQLQEPVTAAEEAQKAASEKVAGIKEKLKQLEDEKQSVIKGYEQKIGELQGQLDQVNEKLAEVRQDRKHRHQEFKRLTKEAQKLKHQIQAKSKAQKRDLIAYKQAAKPIEKRLAAAQRELDQADASLKALEGNKTQIAQLQAQISELEKQISELQ